MAAQRGRRDVVVVSWKFFTGRVSPNENLTQLLLLRLYVYSNWSFEARHSRPPASPLPPIRRTATSTRHLYTARQSNEPYTPREACDEPLIPHSTRQPGYTRAAFRLPLHLWLGMYIGDLGWGPRTRHLVIYYTRPAVPLGWKSCCKQEVRRRIHTHIQGIQMGARAGTQDLTAILRQSTLK